MNFFEQQDIARRNTRLLVVLFILAVAVLVFITLAFLVLFPWQTNAESFAANGSNQPLMCLMSSPCDFWASVFAHSDKLIAVSTVLVVIIGGVSLFKWFTLLQGGKVIAEMMGADEIRANTINVAEKRLLNVVEEMAIAANMPVPAVYVMRRESGINAFAAGFSPKDAVIAVTQGALQGFNREQLQAVVAHEFSHILNGDMRLNMQIIAVLHGIMFITEIGYVFLRPGRDSGRNRRNGLMLLLGAGLVLIGLLGTLLGNLVKAAISRQREFLADASSVQFTRNPGAMADALKVIGGSDEGSLIMDGHGVEISHLFFGQALTRMQGFFATHPPLPERIRRIEPRWGGTYLKPALVPDIIPEPVKEKPPIDYIVPVMAATALLDTMAHRATDLLATGKDTLHQPLGAAAAICCLLLHPELESYQRHLRPLEKDWPQLYQAILASPWKNSPRQDFLPVVELAISALRMLDLADYNRFKQLLLMLMKADGVIDIYEWSLYYLLKASLDCHFGQAIIARPRYRSVAELEAELRIVIAMLVQSSQQGEDARTHAFERAYAICGMEFSENPVLPVAMAEFTTAMRKLSNAYPLLKGRVMKALVTAARSDGEVDSVERSIIQAIAAAIDTPVFNLEMPDLL